MKRGEKIKVTLRFHSGLARKMVVPLIKVVNSRERSRCEKGRCNVWSLRSPMTLPSIDVKQANENLDVDTMRGRVKAEDGNLNDCPHSL